MPDPSKLRWSQLRVGVVALSSFIILFVLVFLLTSTKGGLFKSQAKLRTYMDDASGLVDGRPLPGSHGLRREPRATLGPDRHDPMPQRCNDLCSGEMDRLTRNEAVERRSTET